MLVAVLATQERVRRGVVVFAGEIEQGHIDGRGREVAEFGVIIRRKRLDDALPAGAALERVGV